MLLFASTLRPTRRAPLAVGIAIIASFFLGLGERGVATVGEIPRALPDIVLPRSNLLLALWPAAAAIALMSFTKSIAAAAPSADRTSLVPTRTKSYWHLVPPILRVAYLVQCLPAAVQRRLQLIGTRAPARSSQGTITAAAALLALLVLAPLVSFMPQAALAAVVVAYSVDLIEPAEFPKFAAYGKPNFIGR